MGAADYYSGSNAPQTSNYAPPALDFSGFSGALDSFVKGRQQGREEDQARAFRNGIPTEGNIPNGNPDYGAMSKKMIELGNYPMANTLQQTGITLQQLRNAGNLGGLIGPGSAGAPAAGSPQAAVDPAVAGGPAGAAAPAGAAPVQARPVAGAAINAPNSIVSSLPDTMDPTAKGKLMVQLSRELQVDPNAPLNQTQAERLRSRLASLTPDQAGVASDAAGPSVAPDGMPTSVPLPAARPAGAPGAAPGAAPAAAAPFDSRFDASRTGGPPAAPDPVRVAQTVQATGIAPQAAAALESRLDAMPVPQRRAYLNQLATSPAFPKSVNDWAEARTKQLEQDSSPTPAQKDYAGDKRPGETMTDQQARAAATIETAKKDVESYTKRYDSIQKSAQEVVTEQPKMKLAKEFLQHPNFMSGPFEGTDRLIKQLKATFGGDPNAAFSQESFKKITSDMLTSSIRQLGASGAGPVRVAEVQNMQKAIASLGLTAVTNRLLIEMTDRTYNDVKAIAELTRKYEADPNNVPGKKTVGLDTAIQKYYDTHPMFTPEEMRDPRLIAPPEFKNNAAAVAAKLPRGQPLKVDGKLVWAP